MNTPVVDAAGRLSLALRSVLYLGSLLLTLWSHRAAAQDVVPLDVYGRPLADELGRITYRQDGDTCTVVHEDGSWDPGPLATSVDPGALPSETPPQLGFRFQPYQTLFSGSIPRAVAIGDVTGDGRPDVVMTTGFYFEPLYDYKLLVYAQTPDGNLGPPVRYTFSDRGDGLAVALADFDEDGVLDAVVGHGVGITVLLADGHGGLRAGVQTLDADAYKVVAMDVDRDGHKDVVSLGWSRGGTIFFGDGHGGFRQQQHLETYARGSNDLKAGDLTGDGIDDLAVMSGNYGAFLTVHPHDGVGGFSSAIETYGRRDSLFAGVGIGDVSGDGLNDVVLSDAFRSERFLQIMTQDPTEHGLMDPISIPTFVQPAALEVADVDGDRREDVVVIHGTWVRLGVYLQAPGGGLAPEVLYPIPFVSYGAGKSMAIGDVSSDGCADVVFGTYPLGLVVLRGSGCVPLCEPGSCDDGDCCTIDSCNPATGCVHVANTIAPIFSTQPTLGDATLWPANHGYVDFAPSDTSALASSNCGIASIQFASCVSSQPENGTGTGDGNTVRDCVYEPGALHLRAERDGACSPTGRVYTSTLAAVDVCGNMTASDPFSVNVWHDRAHPPPQGTVRVSAGDTQDVRGGANGTYGTGCGTGAPSANGTYHDHSDADPEMELSQNAAVSVGDLHLGKTAGGNVQLTWSDPTLLSATPVTRWHVYRLDPATHSWTQIAELPKQELSHQSASLNDGGDWQYKVTAVIK